MSYYNNRDDWKQIDEFQNDSSHGGDRYEPNRSHQSMPPTDPRLQIRQSDQTKNYNSFLDRQGIPAISIEDMQIINQCNRESFYYRCLPISAALCSGIVYMARTSLWKPRFYHYFGAIFLGYFGGKFSYRSTCEEKLINSKSNSPFVNAIRKRRGLFIDEFDHANQIPRESIESDWSVPKGSYGIDEFDNENRPPFVSQDHNGSYSSTDHAPTFSGSSYDDLRARNRSHFKNV